MVNLTMMHEVGNGRKKGDPKGTQGHDNEEDEIKIRIAKIDIKLSNNSKEKPFNQHVKSAAQVMIDNGIEAIGIDDKEIEIKGQPETEEFKKFWFCTKCQTMEDNDQ